MSLRFLSSSGVIDLMHSGEVLAVLVLLCSSGVISWCCSSLFFLIWFLCSSADLVRRVLAFMSLCEVPSAPVPPLSSEGGREQEGSTSFD